MLKLSSVQLLGNLRDVFLKLKDGDYTKEIDVLNQTSISKHIRHILDFYLCLIEASNSNNAIISYDQRRRDEELEQSVDKAAALIEAICLEIDHLDLERNITLQQKVGDTHIETSSNLGRELLYNMEHTIHHMAIIKIAITSNFPYLELEDSFGVAPSTIAYRKNLS